ncbi:hypothetical protein NFI96_000431 [Prochilodus magdalenae]|nr:hypothetical protein NFI96_000431 [Prochilodus magdalenae]
MVEESGLRVVRCGGNKISFRPPIISKDGRFLVCASGDSVKVFSTSTEECLHVLQGHTDQVTGVALNPANHLQVYSCSADGTVRLWDFIDGILIKIFTIGYPIFSLYVSEKHVGVIFIIIPMASNKHDESCQLVAVHLPKVPEQEVEARELSAVLCKISTNPGSTAVGQGAMHLLSGGLESVLVQWHCEEVNKKDFLPRLGGPISHICVSPDGTDV